MNCRDPGVSGEQRCQLGQTVGRDVLTSQLNKLIAKLATALMHRMQTTGQPNQRLVQTTHRGHELLHAPSATPSTRVHELLHVLDLSPKRGDRVPRLHHQSGEQLGGCRVLVLETGRSGCRSLSHFSGSHCPAELVFQAFTARCQPLHAGVQCRAHVLESADIVTTPLYRSP